VAGTSLEVLTVNAGQETVLVEFLLYWGGEGVNASGCA
jgi:hypothetical protein